MIIDILVGKLLKFPYEVENIGTYVGVKMFNSMLPLKSMPNIQFNVVS